MNDRRAAVIYHVDYDYDFTPYESREAWEARRERLRRQILVAAGLWSLPERTPLNPIVTGVLERDGYVVEKVALQTLPGLYLCGNLYLPASVAGERLPAIGCPHGHSQKGRLNDDEVNSTVARCIQFARMGCVAFAWDMVGYNDTWQIEHRAPGTPAQELWGISNLGFQLWNSIRALDFLESLPYVDPARLACTGESGGGTQTFLLTAVDERVSVAAPVVMVSHLMQGGCRCENCGSLRLDTFNVEIAAMAAPRPMILVSATGDWTRDTPHMEYPAIQSVYRLYGAEDNLAERQIDAPHNYNQRSREAVYGFFAHYLLGRTESGPLPEQTHAAVPDEDLLVWHGCAKPADALTQDHVVESFMAASERRLAELMPNTPEALAHFREVYGPGYAACLAAALPAPDGVAAEGVSTAERDGVAVEELVLGRVGEGDRVPATLFTPRGVRTGSAVLIVYPEGRQAALAEVGLAGALLAAGHAVLAIDAFNTGDARAERDLHYSFWTCYNRTDTAHRVQDVLTALGWLAGRDDVSAVHLVGVGEAGLWCLLARPLAPMVERTVVDAAGYDGSDAYLLDKLFVPSLRRVGDLRSALALSAPGPLYVYNTAPGFPGEWAHAAYAAAGASEALTLSPDRPWDADVTAWLAAG